MRSSILVVLYRKPNNQPMQMEEEDWDFSSRSQTFQDATKTNRAFYRRILQTIQALKGKSNPKQPQSKCNFTSSSSFEERKYYAPQKNKKRIDEKTVQMFLGNGVYSVFFK
jgi:hypothetical protein